MSRENRDDGEADDVLEAEALMLLGRVQADDGDGPLDAMLVLTAFEERSERHRIALARVSRVWNMTGLIDPATLAVEPTIAPHPGTAAVPRRIRAGFSRRAAGVSRPVGMIAAAAAVAAGVALLVIPPVPPGPPTVQDYATARGETRPIWLADGSRIVLGAGTKLSAGLAKDRRTVQMLAGQALFTVAHDASRPFVVTAGTITVRDIGTVFSITRHADATTVAVAEGMVAASAPGATAVRVTAGQQLRMDRTGRGSITAIVPGMTNGWEEGLLRYRGTPLSDVIADINRYAATPLRLSDPAIARLPYSGTVRADAIGEWVVALPYAFPVTIRRRADHVDILPRGATADRAGR